jgi:hypothetical protein
MATEHDLAVCMTTRWDVPELLVRTLDLRPLCYTGGSGISAVSESRKEPRCKVGINPYAVGIVDAESATSPDGAKPTVGGNAHGFRPHRLDREDVGPVRDRLPRFGHGNQHGPGVRLAVRTGIGSTSDSPLIRADHVSQRSGSQPLPAAWRTTSTRVLKPSFSIARAL